MTQKIFMIMPNLDRKISPHINSKIIVHDAHNSSNYLKPIFFDNFDEVKEWFLNNIGQPIPVIYIIQYIESFEGVSDVIKINFIKNPNDGQYYTAVNKNLIIKYIESDKKWLQCGYFTTNNPLYYFEEIYKAFEKRGISLNNVYENNKDRISSFDVLDERGNHAEVQRILQDIYALRDIDFVPSGTLKEKQLLKRLKETSSGE